MWVTCGGIFDLPKLKTRLAELETVMAAPDFWDRREAAQRTIEEANGIRERVEPFTALARQVEDLDTLRELVAEETDEAQRTAAAREFVQRKVTSSNLVLFADDCLADVRATRR